MFHRIYTLTGVRICLPARDSLCVCLCYTTRAKGSCNPCGNTQVCVLFALRTWICGPWDPVQLLKLMRKYWPKLANWLEDHIIKPLSDVTAAIVTRLEKRGCNFTAETVKEQADERQAAVGDGMGAVNEELDAKVEAKAQLFGAETVRTAALLTSLVLAVTSLIQYLLAVPYGGGLCRSTYVTYIVVYRPFSVSMFAVLVALCDTVHWRAVEKKPKETRKALKLTHTEDPPMKDNSFVVAVSIITSLGLYFWVGAAIVFLPLALVFVPVVIGMAIAFPVVSARM